MGGILTLKMEYVIELTAAKCVRYKFNYIEPSEFGDDY